MLWIVSTRGAKRTRWQVARVHVRACLLIGPGVAIPEQRTWHLMAVCACAARAQNRFKNNTNDQLKRLDRGGSVRARGFRSLNNRCNLIYNLLHQDQVFAAGWMWGQMERFPRVILHVHLVKSPQRMFGKWRPVRKKQNKAKQTKSPKRLERDWTNLVTLCLAHFFSPLPFEPISNNTI